MGIHILLVEDNPGDAYLLRAMLAQADPAQFELTHVERLDEALERLDKAPFDLVLLDLTLPDSQGFETFAHMRARAPGVPIIVLSGLDDEALTVRAVREGAQDYLIKGEVSSNLLVRAIRYALERKRTQDALKESEARYRAVIEDQTELISRFLPSGELSFANDAYRRYFAEGCEELVGHGFTPRVFHEDREKVEQHIAALGQQNPVRMIEHRVVTPDGEIRWQQWINRAIFDEQGCIAEYQSVGRDITKRVQMEEALRHRNRELTLLNRVGRELSATLELRPLAERLLREGTEIVDAEAASVWLWDREQADILVCEAAFIRDQKRLPLDQRVSSGQGVVGWVAQTGETVVVPRATDDPRFFPDIDERIGFDTRSLLAVPLKARDRIIGVLEMVNKLEGRFDRDDLILVETLSASAAIAIDNARLVEALRQYTEELEATNEELDAFAHTVAHDLKGPLGYIVGYAELLKESHDPLMEQDLGRYLHTITKKGRKMASIIDALLLLAGVRKIEEVKLGPLDMASVVAEVQERMADMVEETQSEIILLESWPVALGYAAWVEEVWVNFLSNAIKYGGQPPRVELGATPPLEGTEGGHVRFWVRDNGLGLTPDEQARLFKPFTRFHQVSTKGHGLGLSIVWRIVEKLGGQVDVESEVGQGSVFSFTLPAAPGSS